MQPRAKQTPEQINNSVERGFRAVFSKGTNTAAVLLPELLDGQLNYARAASTLDAQADGEDWAAVAKLMLALPELAKGEDDTSKDISVLSKAHQAMKDIMLASEGSSLNLKKLVNTCTRFADTNVMFSSVEQLVTLGKNLERDITAMWYEETAASLLCAASIPNKEASISDDLNGIDIFVQPDPEKDDWVAVDIKTSEHAIANTVKKRKETIIQTSYITSGVFTDRNPGEGSPDNPTLYIVQTDSNKVYVCIKTGGFPDRTISPLSFQGKPQAIESALRLQEALAAIVANGQETYKQVQTPSGKKFLTRKVALRAMKEMGLV